MFVWASDERKALLQHSNHIDVFIQPFFPHWIPLVREDVVLFLRFMEHFKQPSGLLFILVQNIFLCLLIKQYALYTQSYLISHWIFLRVWECVFLRGCTVSRGFKCISVRDWQWCLFGVTRWLSADPLAGPASPLVPSVPLGFLHLPPLHLSNFSPLLEYISVLILPMLLLIL